MSLKLKIPVCTSTVPVLLKDRLMLLVPVPADLRNVPALLKTPGVLSKIPMLPWISNSVPLCWLKVPPLIKKLLALESTPRSIKVAQPLVERAGKLRILGSIALSIALTSAGGFDVFCASLPMRVFDMAASFLLLAEAGGVATNLNGDSLGPMRCDLETRSTLLCAPTRELHAEALRLLGNPR